MPAWRKQYNPDNSNLQGTMKIVRVMLGSHQAPNALRELILEALRALEFIFFLPRVPANVLTRR